MYINEHFNIVIFIIINKIMVTIIIKDIYLSNHIQHI